MEHKEKFEELVKYNKNSKGQRRYIGNWSRVSKTIPYKNGNNK